MFAALIILVPLGLSQIVPVPEGNGEIYRIVLEDDTVLYGTYEEIGPQQVKIDLDSPWDPGRSVSMLRSKVAERHLELRHRRKDRRTEQAAAAGYAYVETPGGAWFVPQHEAERAQRSDELARAALAQEATSDPVIVDPQTVQPATTADAPGFWARFGRHVLVLAFGLAALALVVKTLILG